MQRQFGGQVIIGDLGFASSLYLGRPDILYGLAVPLLSVVPPSSLGGSDIEPVGACRRPGVALGLNEGLDEQERCVVALGPVLGQAPADDCKDVRVNRR